MGDSSGRTVRDQITDLRKRKVKTAQILDPVNDMKLMKCEISIPALRINIGRGDQPVIGIITQSLNGNTCDL